METNPIKQRNNVGRIPGLTLFENFIDGELEELARAWIDGKQWMTSLQRRVQHYGYEYDYRRSGKPAPAPEFPQWMESLATAISLCTPTDHPPFDQCIVNEYEPHQGIGMHSDHRMFGPIIAAVSLLDTWTMRFRQTTPGFAYHGGGLAGDTLVTLPRRSLIVFAGAARHQWMHGIDNRLDTEPRGRRLSITFRYLAEGLENPS